MKHILFIACFLFFSSHFCNAQYPIGTLNTTIWDAARSRDIPVYIYYPGISAGTSVSLASPPPDGFPVVVFGHGFAMDYSPYLNFRDSLVPKGYILIIPNSESAIIPFPSHPNFGKDLAFCITWLAAQDSISTSLFYNKVSPKRAIMGHSMGGGSTYLGAQNNPSVTTTITFSAAETNPLSSSAAKQVIVPSLVFSGQNDCVAPLSNNQQKIYDSLGASCKTLVILKNGGHCQYANSNFNCDFGESSCRGTSTLLTRPQQQTLTFRFLYPWLDFYLKGNCNAYTQFQSLLSTDPGINYSQSCSYNLPAANIFRNGPNNFCNDTFTSVFCSGSFSLFQWSDGSTDSFVRTNRSFTYTCTVTDQFGCKDTSNSIRITSFTPLKPTLSKSNLLNLCRDSIKVNVIGNFTQWLWNDSLIQASRYIQTPGSYYVFTIDSNACKSSSDTITVINTIPLSTSQFWFQDTTICPKDLLCLSADARFFNIRWNSSDTSFSICKNKGIFWYSALDSNQCLVYSDTVKMDTFTPLLPIPTALSATDFILSPTFLNPMWYDAFGVLLDTNYMFSAPTYGTYIIEATDTNACRSRYTFSSLNTAMLETNAQQHFQLIPNPVSETLILRSKLPILSWQILSTQGKIIHQESCCTHEINFNAAFLPKGFWLLKALLENGQTITKSFTRN